MVYRNFCFYSKILVYRYYLPWFNLNPFCLAWHRVGHSLIWLSLVGFGFYFPCLSFVFIFSLAFSLACSALAFFWLALLFGPWHLFLLATYCLSFYLVFVCLAWLQLFLSLACSSCLDFYLPRFVLNLCLPCRALAFSWLGLHLWPWFLFGSIFLQPSFTLFRIGLGFSMSAFKILDGCCPKDLAKPIDVFSDVEHVLFQIYLYFWRQIFLLMSIFILIVVHS